MNPNLAPLSTKIRVGIFSLFALALIGAITVYVNDRPFWWRPCQLVHINIEDATGLKTKSPIRSLGLQIGYLRSVELSETHVRLGICITAPIEVLSSTRAYIRSKGFLGDKFVELKPVKYTGPKPDEIESGPGPKTAEPEQDVKNSSIFDWLIPSAYAEGPAEVAPAASPTSSPEAAPAAPVRRKGREIPVGEKSQDVEHLVEKVDELTGELNNLTKDLREAINPAELRKTIIQLNKALDSASRTLSPEGSLNTTAQRTLSKLEDAIEQLRDQMTRTNKGQGSLGMLLNDPSYAEEIREVIRNANRLLSKVSGVRFVVNVGAEAIPIYDGTRAWFRLGIWPQKDRYYLLGITIDPRGLLTREAIETCAGGVCTTTRVARVEQSGILINAMLGKVMWQRWDFSLGSLHGDGTVSLALLLGPTEREEMIVLRNDGYSRGQGFGIDDRVNLTIRPWIHTRNFSSFYFRAGLESLKKFNGHMVWTYGAGITFDDDDIKLLFALR